jgi:EAL domain-containing protein (putative c-di-GMP-specific phosphodiesterase class I)
MLNHSQKTTGRVFKEFMVWLPNLDELELVYGSDFHAYAFNQAIARMQGHGLTVQLLEPRRSTLMASGHFSLAEDSEHHGDAERICAAVAQEPVAWGIQLVYLQVEVLVLDAVSAYGMSEMRGCSRTAACRRYPPTGKLRPIWRQNYQSDMYLASSLLHDLGRGNLALAFQPVATSEYCVADPSLYYECLLRRTVPDTRGGYSVPDAIQALERMGLVERLDRSVLWATLGALASSEELSLGCNVSARSFVSGGWWNELLAHLEDRPDLALRLVVEITETSTFPNEKAALGLIRHLQLLGVRIALDDIGKGRGSLDILDKVRANIVKLDKSVLDLTPEGELPVRMLQNMVGICANHGASVIVEGVDSVAKLEAALAAGATGVQGYLIARPSLRLRGLLDDGVQLQDDMQTRTALVHNRAAAVNASHQAKTAAVVRRLFERKGVHAEPVKRQPRIERARPYLVG